MSRTIRLYNPTGRNTPAHVVEVGENTYYFSYRTCIAVRLLVNGDVVRARLENHWGPTTGRHFKELGVKDYPIVTPQEMDDLVARSVAR